MQDDIEMDDMEDNIEENNDMEENFEVEEENEII